MRSLIFRGSTWQAYETLRQAQPQLHRNLKRIITELLRDDPSQGTGKPEPLRHELQGLWSRRLSRRDRVVYRFDEETVEIIAIGGHYGDH